MKKVFQVGSSTLLLVWLVLASSCSRRGCTNAGADNFEPKAKIDCECCQYSGKAVAWYRESFYNYMKSAGVTAYKFKYNGQEVGSGNYVSFYRDSAPTFATNKTDYSYYRADDGKTAVVTIGNVKSTVIHLSCVDQNGSQFWDGDVTINANSLTPFEMR